MLPSSVPITFTIFSKLSGPQEVDADTIKLPLVVILSSNLPVEFTSNPLLGSTDAVTEPLTILNASSVIADNGILNNDSPLPLKIDADTTPLTSISPSIDADVFTINPKFGEIEALTEPLDILGESSESADCGILNKFSPLPLKDEPDVSVTLPLICIEPLNVEPLSVDSTTNPKFGETDAVTEPLDINGASSESADCGMLNSSEPSPTNPLDDIFALAVTFPNIWVSPNNFWVSVFESSPNMFEPVDITMDDEIKFTKISSAVILPLTDKSPSIEDDVFTTNPKLGEIDAVAEPLAIRVASSESADWGMLLSCEPSPATEPLNDPVNSSAMIFGTSNDSDIETLQLNSDFIEPVPNTLNIPSVETEALTEPVVIKFDNNASSTKAERGMLNNPSPLPLKNPLPDGISISPIKIEPLSSEVTLNTLSSVDAVTLPLAINTASLVTKASIASCASLESAENGISNKSSPLPLYFEPLFNWTAPLTNTEPLNSVVTEPVDCTLKKPSVETDAVTEPVDIKFEISASSVNAVLGILNNFSPLPLKNEPLLKNTEPVKVEPLNSDSTTNPKFGETDAVTEPLLILFVIRASSVSAERGISNNSAPLPLNILPLLNLKLPVNVEPLASDVTTNPSSSETDAVTLPDCILVDTSTSSANADKGILNKF